MRPVRGRGRRFNLHLQESQSWQDRAEDAVALWNRRSPELLPVPPPSLRVADLGCGNERLRSILEAQLPVSLVYQGFDRQPQRTSTIRLDLRYQLPEGRFDLVFCLGVLEYLPNLADMLEGLSHLTRFAVASYAIADPPHGLSVRERRDRGWLSDCTRAAFQALCQQAGFKQVDSVLIDRGRTGIWLFVSDSADVSR
jgi:Methyltransferase domain